jgi:hypothetical protein
MGLVVFEIGGMFVLGGFIANLLEYRACQRIHAATKGSEQGLTDEDTWLNIYQHRKRERLRYVSERHSDASLRMEAARALRLEKIAFALIVPGMVLMAIGAASQR